MKSASKQPKFHSMPVMCQGNNWLKRHIRFYTRTNNKNTSTKKGQPMLARATKNDIMLFVAVRIKTWMQF